MKSKTTRYLFLALILTATLVLSQSAPHLFSFLETNAEATILISFVSISILFILSFATYHLSKQTVFPSFVVALLFGIAAQPLLFPITERHGLLSTLVSISATLILFSGGLETPFRNFKQIFWRIMSLSFIGLITTAVSLSAVVWWISGMTDIRVPMSVIILLGATLASTDPASIIPILKNFRFHNRATKDIIISESAVTDVTGTLLTLVFIGIVLRDAPTSLWEGYRALFDNQTAFILLKEIVFGIFFGFVGYGLLTMLSRFTKVNHEETEADAAYFLFVPITTFALAVGLGGSGYLAAFMAGLLFVHARHLQETERFFNHTIEGFLKPMIFILLGGLTNVQDLLTYAGVGIAAALIFMFLIRPLAVFLSLGPFFAVKHNKFSWRDLLFISLVRETGAIPAVLLVTVVSLGIPDVHALLPIGMWVILLTLIIEPPFMPYIAKLLNVADEIEDDEMIQVGKNTGESFVVLGSRGYSFARRLPRVTAWAIRHRIHHVVILLCPEDNYHPERIHQITVQAKETVTKINKERTAKGLSAIDFEWIIRKGFLEENIRALAKNENLAALFVGKRVLDFRLNQIKNLQVPLFFID